MSIIRCILRSRRHFESWRCVGALAGRGLDFLATINLLVRLDGGQIVPNCLIMITYCRWQDYGV